MAYIVIVSAVGVIVIWWLRRTITMVEEQRRKRLQTLNRFDAAVHTESPHENPLIQARKLALESLSSRFSILRRLLIPAVFLLWLVALAYPFLGNVPANVVSLMVAAATVIVGIAAKPYVENLISGIVISFSRLVRIGDTLLIDGNYGTVEDITITHTLVKIWDWRRYIIPNSRMLEKEFINYSIVDTYQWAYVEFWVDHDADIERVREIAVRAASSSDHFANYEAPRFWLMEMGKEGIKCWVAAWAQSPADAWLLKNEIRTELVRELAQAGIRTHTYRIDGLEALKDTMEPRK